MKSGKLAFCVATAMFAVAVAAVLLLALLA